MPYIPMQVYFNLCCQYELVDSILVLVGSYQQGNFADVDP